MALTLTTALVVGHSVLSRPIQVVHVAGPGTRILVVGAIHGNETAGIAVVRELQRSHSGANLWLVPSLNPDGVVHGTRQNAHGVDLNRNFPAMWQPIGQPGSTCDAGARPFSEPETRAARDLIRRIHPQVTVWFHQHMDVVWAYGRSTAAGRCYARAAGLPFLHRRWLAGSATLFLVAFALNGIGFVNYYVLVIGLWLMLILVADRRPGASGERTTGRET